MKRVNVFLVLLLIAAIGCAQNTTDPINHKLVLECIKAPVTLEAWAMDESFVYLEATIYGETMEWTMPVEDWLMLNGDGHWKVIGTPNLGPPPPGSLPEVSDEVTQAGVIINGSAKVSVYTDEEIPIGEGVTVEYVGTEN